MTETTTLYVRIGTGTKEWLDKLSEDSGLSLAKVCDALLSHCRERNVSISTRVAYKVTEESGGGHEGL